MLNRKFQKIFIPEEIRVVLSVRPVRRAGFMLLDILIAIAVIGILASIVFVLFNDHQVAARNVLREDALASLRSGLENYYKANGVYPIETSWCVSGIKDNSDRYYCSNLFLGLKDAVSGNVLDPLFPKNFKSGCRYGYYYRSTQDGKGYELAARLERYSSMAKGNNFLYVSSASPKGAEISFLSDVVDLCSRSASVGGFVSQKNSDSSLFVNYPSAQSGFSDPAEFIYATPFFSFINEQSQAAAAVQIQLSEDNYNTLIWDSGDIAIASTASGQRTPDIFYGSGNPPSGILEAGKNYKWRARVKISSDPEKYSPWSPDANIVMFNGDLTARFYSTGDGAIKQSAGPASQANWKIAHDGQDPIVSSSTAQEKIGTAYSKDAVVIQRGFFPFDSSKLPDNASIIGGSLNVWVDNKESKGDDGKNWVAVVQSFQEDGGRLTPGDYQNCGSDNGSAGRAKYTPVQEGSGRVDIADIPEDSDHNVDKYVNWALNEGGIGWISKIGMTKFGLREGHDVLDYRNRNGYFPSTNIGCNFSENADQSGDPYLEVNYK
jgi:type II secretory pathway pseudopilin PulG